PQPRRHVLGEARVLGHARPTHEGDDGACGERLVDLGVVSGLQRGEELASRSGPVAEHVAGHVVEPGPAGVHHDETGAGTADLQAVGVGHDLVGVEAGGGGPHSQVEGGVLFFEVRAPHDDGGGRVDVVYPGAVDYRGEELGGGGVVHAGVDVVRADDRAHELGERVGVLVGAPGPAEP